MARNDPKVVYLERQTAPRYLPNRTESEQMDDALMVLNVAERMPILSQSILDAIPSDVAFSSIARQLSVLHANLVDLAQRAESAKFVPFTTPH